MKILRPQLFIMISLSATLFMTAQTQIGSDIDGEVIGNGYGQQVSISSDGNIVAVAGEFFNNEGAVYYNNEGSWELHGTDAQGNHFDGVTISSVSLNPSGTSLAIGGGGIARVYTYEEGVWTPKGTNISNNYPGSGFGQRVSLSSDANIIAVSSPTYTVSSSRASVPPPPYAGLVQIFRYESGNWNQIGDDIAGEEFELSSTSISLSSDGSTVAISNTFSVRIYENIGDVWSLKGSEIFGVDNERKRVSISQDGNIVAIGDSEFSDTLIQRGRVTVYEFQSNEWVPLGNEIFGEVAYYRTGWSVSLSLDGQTIAIGEIGSESGNTNKGRVRIFQNQDGSWNQIGNGILGEASEDYSGWSVSLSADASKIAIGSPRNDGGGLDSGHVRVYDLSALLSVNDLVEQSVNLFPNPSREQFMIQLPEGVTLKKVTLYNSLGKLIYTSTSNNTIDTSKLASGVYYVDVTTSKGKSTKKVLVD